MLVEDRQKRCTEARTRFDSIKNRIQVTIICVERWRNREESKGRDKGWKKMFIIM